MKKTIFSILLLAVFAISCNPETKYATQLAEIEKYDLKLDSIANTINGIEIDSLMYMQHEAEENEKVIRTYYSPDTIDNAFAEKLNLNKGVRKSLKGAQVAANKIIVEIDSVKLQFSDLKTDILNGLYNEEQIKSYISIEKQAYEKVELAVKNFDLNQQKQKANFYYANPQISLYTEELLNENQTE